MTFRTDEEYPEFDALEPGIHAVQITRCVLSESQKTGKEMCIMEYTVFGDDEEQAGFSFREYIVLVKKSYGYGKIIKICKAIWTADGNGILGAGEVEGGLDPHDQTSLHTLLLGSTFLVETENKTSGKFTNVNIKQYMKINEALRRDHEAQYGESCEPVLEEIAYCDFSDPPEPLTDVPEGAFSTADGDLPF
jgi:hypothetical protein